MMAMKMKGHTEGHVKQNTSPNIQQTDFGLRAMKTYGNIESRVRRKEDPWEATNNDAEGCN